MVVVIRRTRGSGYMPTWLDMETTSRDKFTTAASSIAQIKVDPSFVSCRGGYVTSFSRTESDPKFLIVPLWVVLMPITTLLVKGTTLLVLLYSRTSFFQALGEKGYVKRMKPDTFNLQNHGTIGKSVGKLRVNDTMSDFLVCHAHDRLFYFSDKGIVYSASAYKIPECSRAAAGTPLIQVPGDSLKWVRHCTNEEYVAMASQNGFVILSSCEIIRALRRNTRGSVAMRLKEGDRMACVDIIPVAKQNGIEHVPEPGHKHKRPHGPWLLFVSENGYGKRVPLSRFRQSPLNRVGLIGYKFSPEDHLAAIFVVGFTTTEDGESDEQVVLVSQSGTVNRIKVRDIPIQSRYARGVILMRLEHAGKIQSASLISASETEIEEVEAAAV